ncbi:MAG TPA: S41 family peptidase [Vicinamibacterales bacterium]|nr:S41 family peptidase [Vicinamibacterales bacterium]
MKRFRVALAATLAAGALVSAQAYQAAETFDAVWKIVRDTHFDPSFDAAKWDLVRTELRPKAVAAKTPGELRAVLRDMLGRLGLSHFAVIPSSPDTVDDHRISEAQPGFDVRLVGRELVVSSLDPDGGASAAGVHAGWIVESIDGTAVSTLLSDIGESTPPRIAQLEAWRLAVVRLRGGFSSRVNVGFVDGAGARVVKSIERRPERGQQVTVGSLPTMVVRVSSSLKPTPAGGKAGVIGFNVWMAAVDSPFQKAMDEFRGADGIVIDLRGNPGGLAVMIMGLAGHFVSDRAVLGVMKTKDAEPLRFTVNPRLVNAAGVRVDPFKGPVAILVDGMTGSASECFAGGLQSLGRVRVFGQTSMGQALPALFDRLPNGDVFIHAWGDFVTGTGVRIEGRGVVPDEPVDLTREDLLAGRDAPLDAALAWIDRAAREHRKVQQKRQLHEVLLRLGAGV